jgi:uncharacterized protein (TIGR02145 family)
MKSLFINVFALTVILLLFNSCKKNQELVSVTDIEGNVYKVVTIGTQIWMQENLKTTKLNDGTNIQNVTDSAEWSNLQTIGLCYLYNDITNKDTYGALYNWLTVETGKICPAGWHVPSIVEVDTLLNYLGGYLVAGTKLMESGTAHWSSPNPSTNTSGFTALPGRAHLVNTSFSSTQEGAAWWTNKGFDNSFAYFWSVDKISHAWSNLLQYKQSGFSIRCIRN